MFRGLLMSLLASWVVVAACTAQTQETGGSKPAHSGVSGGVERGEPANGSSLAGRVVDSAGQPVEDAGVQAWATTASRPSMGSSRTGADGQFEIQGLAAGTFTLGVQAPGYPPHQVEGVEVAQGRVQEPVEVRLEVAELSGRVLGPDGTPAAGVGIVARRNWTSASLGPDPVIQPQGFHPGNNTQARTDDRGEFVLRGLGVGPVVVVAEHESLGDAAVDLELRNGVNPVALKLDPSGRIQGRVVGVGGEPVAGAAVTLTPVTEPERPAEAGSRRPPGPPVPRFGSQSTGDDGRFVFRRLAPGRYRLEATAGKLGLVGPGWQVTVGEMLSPAVELVLVEGEEIHGRLLGMSPAEAQQVHILAYRDRRIGSGYTAIGTPDAEGRYRLTGLAIGRWEVRAIGPAGQHASGVVEVRPEGGPFRLDLDLGGSTVTGSVRADGESLTGGSVYVKRPGALGIRAVVEIQPDGTFQVAGLESGTYRFSVREEGVPLGSRRLELRGDSELHLDLATASLAGHVLSADGEPARDGDGPELFLWDAAEAEQEDPAGTASLDSAGRFDFPRIAPGRYEIWAFVGGRSARATISLHAGGRREIELRVPKGAELTLVPHLANGRHPEHVSISIAESLYRAVYASKATVSTDREARFSDVPTGEWSIVVSASDTAQVGVEVTVPGPPVAITLPPATQLSIWAPDLVDEPLLPLVVTGPDGRIPAAARIGLGTMLMQGRSLILGLPPGTWTARVELPDSRVYEGTAETATDQQTTLVLE